MLKRFKKRKSISQSRSPKLVRTDRHRSHSDATGYSSDVVNQSTQQPVSPTYEAYDSQYSQQSAMPGVDVPAHGHFGHHQYTGTIDTIWRGFETTSNEQLPVWLSDQTLGGASFSANGIDAFLLPTDYLPAAPQIW